MILHLVNRATKQLAYFISKEETMQFTFALYLGPPFKSS